MHRLFAYLERTMPAAITAVSIAVLLFVGAGISEAASLNAQDPIWRIKNTSGDFSIDRPGARPLANGMNAQALEPGDTIRTGVDGRLLMTQGADSMQLAGNTAIVIPHSSKNGSAPAIMQLNGSVEYLIVVPNQKQFSVETPFLAVTADRARFRIVMRERSAHVEALLGDVEVSSRRSGQIAHIKAGQAADVGADPEQSLVLSGKGKFAPIWQSVRARSPVMPASAAMIDKERALLELPEGPMPIMAPVDDTRQSEGVNSVNGTVSVDAAKPKNDTGDAPKTHRLRDEYETERVGGPTPGTKDTRQKVDLLAELSRSDLTTLAATALLTSKVLRLGSAHHFPNAPADDLMRHPIELKNYSAIPSLASIIRSAGDAEKLDGVPTAIHAGEAHFEAGPTRTAISNLEANASNPKSFDSRGTRAALAKFLTTPGQADQLDQPTNSISKSDQREAKSADQPKSDNDDLLLSWGVPLGIGALVMFMTMGFRSNQKKYDKGFDYRY
jgi:FecR protein